MLDERLTEFARRAEGTVDLPDFDAITERGERLRRTRRRRAAVATVAVVALLGGGYLATSELGSPDVGPVRPDVKPWPGSSDLPDVAAGTYELEIDREGFPATARFTIPDGWKGWFGPNRFVEQPRGGYVGVLIGDVEDVATRVCTGPVSEMRPVGDTATELVEALSEIPRHSVVDGPEQVEFDALPTTHLTLRADADASCGEVGALSCGTPRAPAC